MTKKELETRGHIKCRTAPVGDTGPLLSRYEDDVRMLSLHVPFIRGCPLGMNFDSLVIFDLQSDGGLDGFELLHPVGRDLTSGTNLPRQNEKYWRLFLEIPGQVEEGVIGIDVAITRDAHFADIKFGNGSEDSKYLVGPGIVAYVGMNELRRLRVDVSPFLKR